MIKVIFFQWSRRVMLMGDGSLDEVQQLMAQYVGCEVQHIDHFFEIAKTCCGYRGLSYQDEALMRIEWRLYKQLIDKL